MQCDFICYLLFFSHNTQLGYWDGKSKPFSYMSDQLIPADGQQSFDKTTMQFQMRDMRDLAAKKSLSLDTNGFEFIEHDTKLSPHDFLKADKVTGPYYQEMEALLLEKVPGAKRVVIFDHNVRSAALDLYDRKDAEDKYNATQQAQMVTLSGPVTFAHNDYTHRSGPLRVAALTKGPGEGGSYTSNKALLTEQEAQEYLQKRFAIVQVWRPINKPVQDCPLAVLDAKSIGQTDLVESTLVYPDREGYTYLLAPNPEHKWYFAPLMTREEAMLFKCYDTQLDGRARFTAHSAFDLPDVPADAPKRESIEIRALVFFDEERSPVAKPRL